MAMNRAKALEAADKLVRQGKLEEAIRHYHALAEDNPRDVNTINRIGDIYVRLRKNKEAIRQFIRIADFYAGDGFHLKAIAMYKKIAKLDPAHAEANERLAELYGKQGLTIEARTQYLSLVEQCLKAGQAKKAIEIYERILALEPENLKIRLVLADLHGRQGDPHRALDGLLSVAEDLRKRGLNDEALKVLQKASRLQPAHPKVLGEMAEIMQAGGRNPEEVLKTLESLRVSEPGNLRYLQMLVETYLNLGRQGEIDRLVASVQGGEALSVLAETVARYHLSRGDREAAVSGLLTAADRAVRDAEPDRGAALLESILQTEPGRLDILEKLVGIWTTAGNRDGMISVSERLARSLCEKQEWDRARPVLERLLNLDPRNATSLELTSQVEKARATGAVPAPLAREELVPSLEDLERVVDFEVEPEPQMETGTQERSTDPMFEELPDSAEIAEEDETQGALYEGRSVIQEMRGEPAGDPVDEDFLNEHFTEGEVFLKYGLVEKAKEQFQTILARYPEHIPSWNKMKEIYSEEGKKPEAAGYCLRIAAIHRKQGNLDKARELEEEARGIDPGAGVGTAPAGEEAPTSERETSSAVDRLVTVGSPPGLELDPRDVPKSPRPPSTASAAPAAEPTSAGEIVPGVSEDAEELTIEISEEEGGETSGPSTFDEEKISEVDFFIDQGLMEEASEILDTLDKSAPGHPEVMERRHRLSKHRETPSPATPKPPRGDLDMDVERAFGKTPSAGTSGTPRVSMATPPADDDFFDLAAELQVQMADDAPGTIPADQSATVALGDEASLDEIFKAFRKKVDQDVGEDDYETRYNLGIAYKEMGLLDEAIGEFQNASRDPRLFLECCSILGICFREKGMTDLAVKWYRKGLESTGHSEERFQGLRYDLGELHAERGEFPQALALFAEVYGVNSNYRDVASKIRDLRKRVG